MKDAADSQKVLFSSYLSFYHCYITRCLMVVPKVTQIFSSAAENVFFLSSPQRQQNCIFLSTNSYVLPSRNLKEENRRKKPTQILQVINSGKMAAGILQAMGVASTNVFHEFMKV